MQYLKTFLAKFLTIPLIVICLAFAVPMFFRGDYLSGLGVCAGLIAWFWLLGWDSQRDKRKIEEAVIGKGVSIDFIAQYLGGGVVIDLSNKKILAGNSLLRAEPLDFTDVKSVEWEDAPYQGSTMKYNLYINTRNFDKPRLGVGFAGNKALRDSAYSKLSVALDLN